MIINNSASRHDAIALVEVLLLNTRKNIKNVLPTPPKRYPTLSKKFPELSKRQTIEMQWLGCFTRY